METKLTAEQPAETSTEAGGDPVAGYGAALHSHEIAPVSMQHSHPADLVRPDEALCFEQAPSPRELAKHKCGVEAMQSAEAAYAAAERRVLDGGGTEDDAAQSIQAMVPVTILLAPRHFEYLTQRAGIFGEQPGAHLERILREFRSYHDDKRPELTQMEAQRNGGAITKRVA